jgi:SAM-dependent methyltransferase
LTPKQAEDAKFAFILEKLGAVPGDTVLDMGCGTCTFGVFCQERGIRVIGLTLSTEQAKLCRTKGVRALVADFMVLQPELVASVDHVLILGSSEHICTGPHRRAESFAKRRVVTEHLLQVARQYLKQGSGAHRIFFSGLHANPAFVTAWEWFVLERTYGGTFPLDLPGMDIQSAAEAIGLRTTLKMDATKHYYLATVLDRNHFGNPSHVASPNMIALLVLGVLYPYAFYMYVYQIYGLWMWMFDGHHHFAHQGYRFSLGSRHQRPATLWWYVCEEVVPQKQSIDTDGTDATDHFSGHQRLVPLGQYRDPAT